MSKKIAVIILNWNGAALLRKYLPSVIAGTESDIADVIVADNGSTDDSIVVLREEFPEVKVISYASNYGYAEGYNRAIADTRYPYTVLLNSDVRTPERWLLPMYDYMESHPDVGACAPKLLSDTDPTRFEYAGASGGFIDRHGYPFCRGRIFDTVETDNGQYDNVIDIVWATGAALMVRSELYLNAGGLDPKFFAHMEEIDLCWRLHLAGHAVRVVPQSVAYHLGGGSLPASNPRKTYLNFRNNLLLLHKNLPVSDLRKALFTRRLYDTLAFAVFAVKFDFKNAAAVLKAHRDFRTMRKLYTEHPQVNLLKQFPMAERNIILDYNFRRLSKFSQLPPEK